MQITAIRDSARAPVRELGVETRFPSLELSNSDGTDGYGPGGPLAWSASCNSIAGETSLNGLFNRLFGASEIPLAERKYLIDNQGQHYVFQSGQTPLAILWLGMLRQAGVKADRFADSDGTLPGLFA